VSLFLTFVITGLVTGSVYGLTGTGLVLTYKTSGIFNFGHGAVLTAGAYVFYWLYVTEHWDWKLAAAVTVLVLGPLLGIVMELVARQLSRQRTSMKIVGTVGLVVLMAGVGSLWYPKSADAALQIQKNYLPGSGSTTRILKVNVSHDKVLIFAIAVLAVAALYALFRYTRLGISMRAVVDDPDLLDIQGTDPVRVRRLAWIIGCSFSCLSAVLILPSLGLHPIRLTFLAMYAFGAAAIGSFGSIPITLVGGLLIGIAADQSKYIIVDHPRFGWLGGFPEALPFVVLFIVLIVMPRGRLVPPSRVEARPPPQFEAGPPVRVVVGAVVLAGLVVLPYLVGGKVIFFSYGLCQGMLILSLGLLVRTSGQVSLCHAAFAAIGAVAFSQFHLGLGLPWGVAVLLAALVTVPVGLLVALPAIRLSGLYLALATFGFGILIERLVYPLSWMFGTNSAGRVMPRPSVVGHGQRANYFLVLAFFVAIALVVMAVNQSRLGRLLRGMSDSQTAVSTFGLSVTVTKTIVFCLSAFLAAVAGILYGTTSNFASSTAPTFNSFNSLVLIAILALAPFRAPWYAVMAAITTVIPGYLTGARTPFVLNLLFGLFAILISLQGGHPPMNHRLAEFLGRWSGRSRARHQRGGRVAPRHQVVADAGGLEVVDLRVTFGGLVAVDGVDLHAPLGRITGLIGPNGAGKTTTFNACSGINRAVEGRIAFNGADVSGRSASFRARRGLGRTFQLMELCDSLSVFDNVALGDECAAAGARVVGQLAAPLAERRRTTRAAVEALQLCGIEQLADHQAGSLSTGERRLVEFARCLAGPFDLLLLDEPSSGLDRDETARFADVLGQAVAERGCGVLLVEHDMSLVMGVCSYIYVLDFGRLIAQGSPGEIAASDVVRAAYLGSEAVVAAGGSER